MEDFLITAINTFGYSGILFLIFAENIFPPIPSELILVFGGFLTTYSNLNIPGVVLSSTLGSLLGAITLYSLGRILKKERIKKLCASRFGKFLQLKPEHIEKADAWFVRYKYKAVLICRCIPVVRSLISIPAGISGMKLVPFICLTFLGSVIWNTLFSVIGFLCGEAWAESLIYIEMFSTAIIITLLVICAIFIFIKLKKRGKRS